MHHDFAQLLGSACEERIAIDPRSIIPSSLCRITPLPPVTDIREPFCFTSDPLDKLPLPTFNIPPEKLIADNNTKTLLAVVIKGNDEYSDSHLAIPELDNHRSRKPMSELEEPLVHAEFTEYLTLKKSYIPPAISLNESKDEGLPWPLSTVSEASRYQRTLQAEKLGGDVGIVQLLQTWVVEPTVDEKDLLPSFQRLPPYEPVTPPLLPVFSQRLLSIDDIARGLDILPEQTTAEVLADLEVEFLNSDTMTCTTPGSSVFRVSSPVTSPMRTVPDPEDLKLEVPLTPPTSISTAKRVRFNSILAVDSVLLSPKHAEANDGVPDFKDVINEEVQQFVREIEQEQLQEADSTMRVPVPALDFGLPKLVAGDSMDALKRWAQIPRNKWTGIKTLEIGFRWAPFSRAIGEVVLEGLENEEQLESFTLSEKEIQCAQDALISSLESVSLREDEEEVEELLEPAQVNSKTTDDRLSVQELARKKKRKSGELTPRADIPKKFKGATHGVPNSERFSAVNSLDTFMHLRTGKPFKLPSPKSAARPVSSPTPPPLWNSPPLQKFSGGPQTLEMANRSILSDHALRSRNHSAMKYFPAPRIGDLTKESAFIISTILLTTAPFLVRRIRAIYPAAKFYERDFSAPTPSGEPVLLRTFPPILQEADIILSSLTGLVYTTLEALRQRPLPGQTNLYGPGEEIKGRIVALSTRYERLVIIAKLPVGGVQGPDAAVVSSFIGFTAALSKVCNIIVRPVEGASAPEWVVATMVDERDAWKGTGGLLEEETTWEGFLRKLGLNAYAAQEVVKRLVKMKPVGGLIALFRMPDEEIVNRFGEFVGARCTKRLVAVLNKRWGEN